MYNINENEIRNLVVDYGFSEAGFFETKDLVFNEEFRQCCEDNVCGNYNANYSCPPYCGTVGEMRVKTEQYQIGLVVKTELEVDDAYDDSVVKPIKKDHSQRSTMLFKELKKQGLVSKGLAMLAGPCSLCASCMMKEGKPCTFPDERTSCLSAYCLNVSELAETARISLSWDPGQVSFFSLYLW